VSRAREAESSKGSGNKYMEMEKHASSLNDTAITIACMVERSLVGVVRILLFCWIFREKYI
jgi:hypothetical protein